MNTLHAIDWNLWLVLDLLIETGSVTETARRLRRTQSAVSHSLAALREAFRDPLFIRVGSRFEPTPRARALAEPVRSMMQTATRALAAPEVFDPKTLRRTFRLFLSDYAQVVVLPGLMKRLAVQAPHVTLDVHFRSDAFATNLAARGDDGALLTRASTKRPGAYLAAASGARDRYFAMTLRRYGAVRLAFDFATVSGSPAATIFPPSSPAPGPTSINQSL